MMAKVHDLLERVSDANLRSALRDEFERIQKRFDRHDR